uniref:F-box domain-containing protein n=1 Tax=Ananas comosus var. bracteatus TaxID=296719 RepID=A0A6V7QW55_ANACO
MAYGSTQMGRPSQGLWPYVRVVVVVVVVPVAIDGVCPEETENRRKMLSSAYPDELISEVLVRLPVKSLLRFRCVSRTWRSLISDPHLIESHRRRSQQHPSLSSENGTYTAATMRAKQPTFRPGELPCKE